MGFWGNLRKEWGIAQATSWGSMKARRLELDASIYKNKGSGMITYYADTSDNNKKIAKIRYQRLYREAKRIYWGPAKDGIHKIMELLSHGKEEG